MLQALTKQEETDLEKMLSECEDAISDAEAFASRLSRNLSVLDGQNIHSIMGSETQVVFIFVFLILYLFCIFFKFRFYFLLVVSRFLT